MALQRQCQTISKTTGLFEEYLASGDARNDADIMSASLPSMLQSYTSCVNHPPILLGTSSFTATGWEGSFYPKGMRSSDYLAFYAERFHTVEVDSTFYACPAARTVSNWASRTPDDFIFSVKAPQTITHEKVLRGL